MYTGNFTKPQQIQVNVSQILDDDIVMNYLADQNIALVDGIANISRQFFCSDISNTSTAAIKDSLANVVVDTNEPLCGLQCGEFRLCLCSVQVKIKP